jgi:beta-lactamase class A
VTDLTSFAKTFTGVLGVSAVHLETGEQIAYNSDRSLLTASTFKSILLVSLLERVDVQELSLGDRIAFTATNRPRVS